MTGTTGTKGGARATRTSLRDIVPTLLVLVAACGEPERATTRESPRAAAAGTATAVTPAPVDAARASRDEQRSDDELRAAVDELAGLEGIRTLQVWRDGEEIARRAVRGAEWGPHDVKSASKSLLSALVGIALERGVLRSVEQTVAELLPPAAFAGLGPAKREITVEDLLTMRSGLGSTSGEHYGAWVAHRDWVRAALERPLEHPPGTRFTYSTGNSHLLSAILTHATGRSTRELFREWLGEPLGIEVDGWERSPRGIDMGGNAFRISPDELAAFGRLYLAGGTWEGRRVLPESWITASTRRHSAGWPDRYGAYGYLWWKPPGRGDAYLAVGYGGQFLYVDPPTDTLVVVTSSHAPKGAAWDRDVLACIAERIVGP